MRTTNGDVHTATKPDPITPARYAAALETVHANVLQAAREWLGVDVYLTGSGQLVVSQHGREVRAPLHPDVPGNPAALRRQIVGLHAKLSERAGKGSLTPASSSSSTA